MKRIILPLAWGVLLVAGAFVLACADTPAGYSGGGTPANSAARDDEPIPVMFYGYVLDSATKTPLADALVSGGCGWCDWWDEDYTDANGFFVITGGDHENHHGSIGATKPGYYGQVTMIGGLGPSPIFIVIKLRPEGTQ